MTTDADFAATIPGLSEYPIERCSWQPFRNEDDTHVTALVPPGTARAEDISDALVAQGVDEAAIDRFLGWWLR